MSIFKYFVTDTSPLSGVDAVGGTVVSTVLETAGYVVQSRILDNFTDYFISFGALIFIICFIGAVVSVAMYGSYRMAGYILIGPALMFFVVLYREPIEPVAWQFGGGDPVDTSDMFHIGPMQNFDADDRMNVSWFFKWFVGLTSGMVNSISDAILEFDNTEQVTRTVREQLLENVTNAVPLEDDTYAIIQENLFSTSCSRMVVLHTALAHKRFSNPEIARYFSNYNQGDTCTSSDPQVCYDQFINTLPVQIRSDARETLDQKRLLLNALAEAKKQKVTVGPGLQRYLAERAASYRNYFTSDAHGSGLGDRTAGTEADFQNNVGNLTISCGELENVILNVLASDANQYQSLLIDDLDTLNTMPPAERQRAIAKNCVMVNGKVFGANSQSVVTQLDPGASQPWNQPWASGYFQEDCSLASAISMYMYRNVLSSGFMAEGISDVRDNFASIAGRNVLITGDNYEGRDSETDDFYFLNEESMPDVEIGFNNGNLQYSVNGKRPTIGLHTVTLGDMEAAFSSHQQYYMRQTVQELYTLGLNLPYWQGTILFLVAVAFPLLAVVLVIPGKGQLFIYVPLCWLWVKSWDIGYAMVAVFDRIMWDLLPSNALPLQDRLSGGIIGNLTDLTSGNSLPAQGPGFDPTNYMLDAILSADPTYTSQLHAMFTSLALSSIPLITGRVILAGRRMPVSDAFLIFTQEIDSAARDAGSTARSAYGMKHMTALTQGHQDLYSFAAAHRTHMYGGGFGTMFSDKTGLEYAVTAGVLRTAGELAGETNVTNMRSVVNGLARTGSLTAMKAGVEGFFDFVNEKTEADPDFNPSDSGAMLEVVNEYLGSGSAEANALIGAMAFSGSTDRRRTAAKFLGNTLSSWADIWAAREKAYATLQDNFHPIIGRSGELTKLRIASANAQEGDGAREPHILTSAQESATAYREFVKTISTQANMSLFEGFLDGMSTQNRNSWLGFLGQAGGTAAAYVSGDEAATEGLAGAALDSARAAHLIIGTNNIDAEGNLRTDAGATGFGSQLSAGVVLSDPAAQRAAFQEYLPQLDIFKREVAEYEASVQNIIVPPTGVDPNTINSPSATAIEEELVQGQVVGQLELDPGKIDLGVTPPAAFTAWSGSSYIGAYQKFDRSEGVAEMQDVLSNIEANRAVNPSAGADLGTNYPMLMGVLYHGDERAVASLQAQPEVWALMENITFNMVPGALTVGGVQDGNSYLASLRGDKNALAALKIGDPGRYDMLQSIHRAIHGPNANLEDDD